MTIQRAVTFTFWCDDGRYCSGIEGFGVRAGKTLVTTNKIDAIKAAKRLGWLVLTKRESVTVCPACRQRVKPGRKRR